MEDLLVYEQEALKEIFSPTFAFGDLVETRAPPVKAVSSTQRQTICRLHTLLMDIPMNPAVKYADELGQVFGREWRPDSMFDADNLRLVSVFLEGFQEFFDKFRHPFYPQPRLHRKVFTPNYANLFPTDTHPMYRAEVLRPVFDGYFALQVSFTEYKFDYPLVHQIHMMWRLWVDLCDCLHRTADLLVHQCPKGTLSNTVRRWFRWKDTNLLEVVSDLCLKFMRFDGMYALFEGTYIKTLMRIEADARQIVVGAIEAERILGSLEETLPQRPENCISKRNLGLLTAIPASSPHFRSLHLVDRMSTPEIELYYEQRELLMRKIGQLNQLVNRQGKGSPNIGLRLMLPMERFLQELQKSLTPQVLAKLPDEDFSRYRSAAVIATDILDAFQEVRAYLRMAAKRLDHLDPQLAENPVLAMVLEDLDTCFRRGNLFLASKQARLTKLLPLCTFCQLVQAWIREIPPLLKALEEVDVEGIFFLSRVLFVYSAQAEIFQREEPRRQQVNWIINATLHSEGLEHPDPQTDWRTQGTNLVLSLKKWIRQVEGLWQGRDTEFLICSLLIHRCWSQVSAGPEDSFAQFIHRRPDLRNGLTAIFLEVEAKAVEVQRTNPESWNTLVQLVLRSVFTHFESQSLPPRRQDRERANSQGSRL